MSLLTLAVASALLGQLTPPGSPATPAISAATPSRPAAEAAQARTAARELVAAATTLPAGTALTGQPVTLRAALAGTSDRRQQLDAVHAYWRLVEAVADYRLCLDHDGQLRRLRESAVEAAQLRAARAAATAGQIEALAAAVTAQHELAGLMGLPPEAPLPLPADRPHVGSYRTYFAELYSTRPAPDVARRTDRTLPLRAQAIASHVAAVQAADEAVQTTAAAYASGSGRIVPLLEALAEHQRRRSALVAAACRYNHEIADYALSVAGPFTTADTLAGMLVKSADEMARTAAAAERGPATPATYLEPAGSSSGPAAGSAGPREPVPTLAPRSTRPGGPYDSPSSGRRGLTPVDERREPALVPPPREEPLPTLAPPVQSGRLVPITPEGER